MSGTLRLSGEFRWRFRLRSSSFERLYSTSSGAGLGLGLCGRLAFEDELQPLKGQIGRVRSIPQNNDLSSSGTQVG